jgi:hypothetical protein
MKDIKRFVVSFFVVAISMIIIDVIIGSTFGKLIDNMPQTYSMASYDQYALAHSDADCVVIGSSRAVEHYVSHVIADSIGMTVYNAGRGGCGLAYADCLIHEIFERHPPRVVILEYEDKLLCSPDHNIKVNGLKPYYGKYDYLTNMLDRCNPWAFKVSMYSNLFKYNNYPIRILQGYMSPKDVYDGFMSRGNQHINDAPITDTLQVKEYEAYPVDSICASSLDDIINMCEVNQAKLFLVTSPTYNKYYSNNPLLDSFVRDKEYVYVVNDRAIPGFHLHPEWFSDHNHLSEQGAQEFSRVLGSQLRAMLE